MSLRSRRAGWVAAGAVAATALALAAARNHRLARKAERENPPKGRFIEARGTWLHYLEQGEGRALVLLHGNGSQIEDFLSSGLIDEAARTHRVLAFDRPGYGHSDRPRRGPPTPERQADLIAEALGKLGVERATVLGHSWGALVALALARRHPGLVGAMVLESGYYYPTPRLDVPALSVPAVPVVGTVLRHAVLPDLNRALWPLLLRWFFGPAPVPEKFEGFPREMSLRPSQMRSSALESALMIPAALAARGSYAGLRLPVAIVAGEGDRLVDPDSQAERLHGEVPGSRLLRLPGIGHMAHQNATSVVTEAIGWASSESGMAARDQGG